MKMSQIFKVIQVEHFTADTIQLILKPTQPFRYQAGDYIMLGFEQEDLKPFSIASSPRNDGRIELHIRKHEDNAWNDRLFSLTSGEEVLVEGPKPQYQLDEDICQSKKPILFVAGGTGFAPMKALLDELLASGCENTIHFYWGSRHKEDLYMRNQMIALAKHHDNLDYIEVLSEPSENDTGLTGLVHQVVLERHPNLADFRVYLCGPWPMVQTAKEDFFAANLPENQFN